ncbi:MAG TPA: hypothetical protein VF254_01420 [Gammaproteobacteria bacterium]
MTGRDTLFLKRFIAPLLLALSLAACGGGGGGGGNPPDPDPDPDPDPVPQPDPQTITPFTFTPVGNAAPGALVYSDEATMAGFTDAMTISVEGGAYCINLVKDENGDNCTDAAGTINAGDKLSLRATAPEGSGEQVQVAVTITDGAELTYGTTFTVATRVDSSLPADAIVIPAVNGLEPGGQGFTDAAVIDGFTGVLSVSADEGLRISVDGSPFVEGPVEIVAGQSVAFEVTAPAEPGEPATRTVRFSNGENEITAGIEVTAREDAAGSPGAFELAAVTGAALDTDVVTDPAATLSGEFAGLPLTISGGEYSINGGEFTSAPGLVTAGDELSVRVHTASQFATETRARVTVGEDATARTRYFRVTTLAEPEGVNRPDPFVFGKHVNAEPGSSAESRVVALSGFEGELPVSAEAASEAQAQVFVNGAAVENGTLVSAGDTVRIGATAAGDFAASQVVLLHVGEGDDRQTGAFEIVTRTRDVTPLPFDFGSPYEAEHGEEALSPVVTLAGFDGELPVEIIAPAAANAQVAIDGGAFSPGPAVISAGQTVQVKATAPSEDEEPQRVVTVRVGSGESAGEAAFSIVTADVVPNEFSFGTATLEALPGQAVTAGPVTVSGFDGPLSVTVEGEGIRVSIDGEAFGAGGNITAGQTLAVELTAPAAANAERTGTVHLGIGSIGVSASVTVRTLDVEPNDFSFTPPAIASADPGSVHLFTSGPLAGFVGSIQARGQSGAVFRVVHDGIATEFNADPKDVVAGDIIELQVTADSVIGNTKSVLVTLGDEPNARVAGVSVTTGDNAAPEFSIDFPTPKSVTQAETVTLTGRFTENHRPAEAVITGFDNEGNPLEGIVRADGHWQMVVDLDVGQNVFTLEMTDSVGLRSSQRSVEILRDSDFFTENPRAVAFDDASGIVYALQGTDTFVSIDLATRQRRVISSDTVGSGEAIEFASNLLFDASNGRLITWNCSNLCRLFAIDITTGARVAISTDVAASVGLEPGRNGTFLFIQDLPDAQLVEFDENNAAQPFRVVSRFSSDPTQRIGAGNVGLNGAWDLALRNSTDTVYVITYEGTGVGNDLRRVIAVDYDSGDRTIVSENNQISTFGLDKPYALSVHQASGTIYVLDQGREVDANNVEHFRPIFRINPETGQREIVVSNALTPSIDLVAPSDIMLVNGGGDLYAWVADAGLPQGIATFTLGAELRDAMVPEALQIGSGADFDAPFALELDAENDRLVVLSERSLQTVDIADGLRSAKIYEVPDGLPTTFGGMDLHIDKLWLTTNDAGGLATIPASSLGIGSAALTQLPVGDELPLNGDLLVEGDVGNEAVYVLSTRDDGSSVLRKAVIGPGSININTLYVHSGDITDTAQDSIYRYAPGQLLLGAETLIDDDGSFLFGFITSTPMLAGDAYDDTGQHLFARYIDVPQVLYRFEVADPESVTDTLVVENTLPVPGFNVDVEDLSDLALDAERNRLYGLLDGGRNVVAINVAEILFNDQGLPARKGDTLSGDGPKPSGDAVLISRSENLETPPPQ